MKIIFVRHGKDDDRYRGGWSGVGLTMEGTAQAQRLAQHMKGNCESYDITEIISSDLPRALETANHISEALRIPVRREKRLREINNGALAGMLDEDAREKYPGLFFSTMEMGQHYPQGESPREFFARIDGWFKAFLRDCAGGSGNALVVTHAGVINIVYHLVRQIPWSNQTPPFKAANCGLHALDAKKMRFELENWTGFLEDIR